MHFKNIGHLIVTKAHEYCVSPALKKKKVEICYNIILPNTASKDFFEEGTDAWVQRQKRLASSEHRFFSPLDEKTNYAVQSNQIKPPYLRSHFS